MHLLTADKKNAIAAALTTHSAQLAQRSREAFEEALPGPFRIGLANLLYDEQTAAPLLSEDRVKALDLRIGSAAATGTGLRLEPLPKAPLPRFGTPEYGRYLKSFYDLEDECERLFWQDGANRAAFEALPQFDAYEDVTVAAGSLGPYRRRGELFNTEGWLAFARATTGALHPDFRPAGPGHGAQACFVRTTGGSCDLCLVYDERLFKKELKSGRLLFPDTMLAIVPAGMNLRALWKDWAAADAGYLIAGPASNPFIGDPCTTISTFFARMTLVEKEPGHYEFVNGMRYDTLPEGRVRIHNSEAFGLLLKRHFFFYTAANRHYLRAWTDGLAALLAER